eukprot:10413011-Prorocentrum_lima.AAC.1
MTSSLVGSEMCIRDSLQCLLAFGYGSLAPLGPLEPGLPRPSRALLKPVSYTHLTLPTICSV